MKLHLRYSGDFFGSMKMACNPSARKRVLCLAPKVFKNSPEDEKCTKCSAIYHQRAITPAAAGRLAAKTK